MSVKRRDNQWIVEFKLRGQHVYRRLPRGESKEAALALEARLRIEIGQRGTVNADPQMAEIMGLYLAHADSLRSPDTARFHALRVAPVVVHFRASQSVACAAAIKDAMRNYRPATINRSLGALKKGLRLAWERGLIPENYGARVGLLQEHNERQAEFGIGGVEQIAQRASTAVRAAIWIALYTGMRRGEIVKLEAADIQADAILVRASHTKTLRVRMVPIVEPLRPWLRHVPLGIGAEGLATGWDRARRAAGFPGARFHDLRHLCATVLVQAGVDLYRVSRILGHSRVTTTERYAHLEVDQLTEAMRGVFK